MKSDPLFRIYLGPDYMHGPWRWIFWLTILPKPSLMNDADMGRLTPSLAHMEITWRPLPRFCFWSDADEITRRQARLAGWPA